MNLRGERNELERRVIEAVLKCEILKKKIPKLLKQINNQWQAFFFQLGQPVFYPFFSFNTFPSLTLRSLPFPTLPLLFFLVIFWLFPYPFQQKPRFSSWQGPYILTCLYPTFLHALVILSPCRLKVVNWKGP